jgi:hypothetical protein
MIGFGIAQRTFLAEPDEMTVSTTVSSSAPVTVIDGTTLNSFTGTQKLSLSGSDTVFAAYGRTSDVLAWIGDSSYNTVAIDPETQKLTNTLVPGTEKTVPNPTGSDLWLAEYTRDDSLTVTASVPSDVSFIVVSDGTKPAPDDIAISWPLDNSAPWSGPLIIAGAVALLLGLGLLLWAIGHMRSSRGPRRKPQKMPKVPRAPRYKPARRAIGRGMIAVPVVLVGTLMVAGCSPEAAISTAAVTPSPSATGPAAAKTDPPAATVKQVERIIADISAVAAKADAAKDSTLLATRFDGAALELRTASYAISTADASIAGLPAIPAGPVKLTLPEQTDSWPRTVFAVIQDDADDTIPPVAMYLTQADPRSQYKVSYAVTLEPAQGIPKVAPADIGAGRLSDDTALLRMSPTDVALAYADILERDVDSESYLDFDATNDSLRTSVGLAKKQEIRASLPATASITFGHAIGPAQAIALATNDAGAIIAVNLYETTTVAPVEAGAAVNPTGAVKALSGLSISTKGVIATYSDQLLFYVPAAGSDGKIVLLGYSQGLVKAGEIG